MEYVRLKDVTLSTQYGFTASETSKTEGKYKYLRITDIVPYFVNYEIVPFCNIHEKQVPKYLVNAGDILIARTGATTGYNYVVPEGIADTVYASYLIRFVVNKEKCLPTFLKYVLKSKAYYGFVNNYIGGSAQPGMNAKVFGKFCIPNMPIDTQHRIASILSAYDSLIENNTKRIRLLEKMAENLYKEWFVRFRFPGYEKAEMENGLPKGWKVERLGEWGISLDTGKRPKGGVDISLKDGYPSLGAECIKELAFFDYSSVSLIPKDFYESMKRGKNTGDDILLYKDGAYIGKVTMFMDKYPYEHYAINEHVFFVAPKNVEYKNYLYFTLHQNEFFVLMQNLNRNAAQPGLSRGDVERVQMTIPTSEVVKQFNQVVKPMLKIMFNLAKQNTLLARRRDLLLPRLMSGKLEVKP